VITLLLNRLNLCYSLIGLLFFMGCSGIHAQDKPEVGIIFSPLQLGSSKVKLTMPKHKFALGAYKVFEPVTEKYSAWLSFIAPFDGDLTIEMDGGNQILQLGVLDTKNGDQNLALTNGTAEIARIILNAKPGLIALSNTSNLPATNTLAAIKMTKGQMIALFINAASSSEVLLRTEYKPTLAAGKTEKKQVNLRSNELLNELRIEIRNAETGAPVIASVNISGMKQISNYYVASELLFDIDRSKKIHVKCDAEGFFFFDKEFQLNDEGENHLIIPLEPLKLGKKLGLPEIQFEMGTSNPTGNAYQLMDRLVEFLKSNSEVRIEIQGHVHDTGDNSLAAKKISEARAKRVYLYLIDKGIDKSRLEFSGYGNTEMIYPKPKNQYEEQANRRVEIKILD
jgi:outer membrane protein OmpA-like peptidoglycan-associated protein